MLKAFVGWIVSFSVYALATILRLHIGSCFVLSKWVDGEKISHAVQVVGNVNIFLQFIDKGVLLLKKIPDEDFFTTPSGNKNFMKRINYSVIVRTRRKPKLLKK